jgi:hypothetical protein
MHYTRLYTGPDGLSYFEDVEVPLTDRGSGTELSELFDAKSMAMRRNTSAYELDYHTASRRQFVVNLTGIVEIVASGGETRRFGPGSIMLAEDTTGKGHLSQAVEGKLRQSIFVPVE